MNQLLPFQLGQELYGLELVCIQEVVEAVAVSYLPGSPSTVLGAANIHGRILPVLDLPGLLGFPVASRSERMIVLDEQQGPLVLAVDQLRAVLNVDLEQSTLSQSGSEMDCIKGVLNWHGEMISLLDLDQLKIMVEQLCEGTGG